MKKKNSLDSLRPFLGDLASPDILSIATLQCYQVAVLVCEIADFESLVRTKSALDIKELLDRFYDGVSAACQANAGNLMEMFQGRCYCVFGSPIRIDKPRECANRAADQISAQWCHAATVDLPPIRVAVDEGDMHCGMFGTGDRRTFEGFGEVIERAHAKLREA